MGGESRQKVNLDALIKELVNGVKVVDENNSLTRSEKTKAITRLAKKFKNELHDDKRRKSDSKIKLSTYRKYLTEARRAITAQNWRHHSLDKEVARISKKHPAYAEQLQKMAALDDITELRMAHQAILKSIKHDDDGYEAIRSMKLDHEVMRHLTQPAAQKKELADDAAEKLEDKSINTISLNYHKLMSGVIELLTTKTKVIGATSTYSFSRLALGIALATGRRSIEILKQGKFKKIDNERIEFSGQAKKRGGADYSESFQIYTLVDADLVLNALKNLRNLPEIKALNEYDKFDEIKRNDFINKRCAKTLNTTTKAVFKDGDRVFKDSRAIYSRICYELFFKQDSRWKNKNEDIFWRELLGHEDTETQRSYKQFKISFDKLSDEKSPAGTVKFKSRLAALKSLDKHDQITGRKAMSKIHDWVKATISADPEAKITQSLITRELKSGRQVIKDYLGLAAEALATINQTPDTKAVEVPAAVTQAQKPKLKIVHHGSGWLAQAIIDGRVVASVTGSGSRAEVLKQLWAAYQSSC